MQTVAEKFRNLLQECPLYDEEAYRFIYETLGYILKRAVRKEEKTPHHVTIKELAEGFRLYAIEQFGCLAKIVLNELGVRTTKDIGQIVFNLIEHDLLRKQPQDKREDFNNLYDFNKVFNLKPKFKYNPNTNELETKYVQKR